MKFILTSLKFLKAVQAISGVINSSNTLPILDDFLFEFTEDTLKVTASDLETTMTVAIKPDMVEGVGKVTVPARLLIDTLKNLPDIPLTFNIDEVTLGIEITTGEGHYKMVGHKSDEFPQVPALNEPMVWEIPADVLACGFEKTIFAAGNDEIRPIMTGVYMEMKDNSLTFVATDAHKLVRYRRFDVKSDITASFIVPKKPINQLKSVLSSRADESVRVEFDNKNATFTFGEYRLVCRLIEGRYPNYEAVIPASNPNSLIIDRQLLNSAIKRVSVFSSKATHQIRFKISGRELLLTAEDLDYSNEAKERLSCNYSGNDIEIGFSSRFFQEMLANISQPEVKIEMSAPNRAGIITPVNNQNADEDILMLLMPVMLS